MLRPKALPGFFLIPLLTAAAAAPAADETAVAQLDGVTVLGTRTERPADELPRSVDIVPQSRIDHLQGNDLGSLIDGLPNVSLTGSPRPSGEQVQIRGLSGERVLTLIDGVRQDYTKGHLGNTFIDPDLLKQVDVERGPASVLWGSGALGGVISAQTVDAADLLAPGQRLGARLKGGYQSATRGGLGTATLYGARPGVIDALLSLGHRDNGDIRMGGGEELPYSGYRSDSVLAKATFFPGGDHWLRVSHRGERLRGDAPSNPAADITPENPLLARAIERSTSQVHWQWMPDSPAIDLDLRLYHSRTRVDETSSLLARQDLTGADTWGFDAANSSRFRALGGDHVLTYGMDGSRDEITGSRNGAPRPEFPDARRELFGVFAQDQVRWGAWTGSVGMRHDQYHSKAKENVAPAQDDSHTSFQAGVVWQATAWLSAYASYAEAFRAPSLDQMYPTGIHFGANRFVPNPSLKPERAANKEIGLRGRWKDVFEDGDDLRLELAAFRNDVRDFIDTIVTVQPLRVPPFVGGTTRSENVTNARLQGFEFSANYERRRWFAALGYGQTRGTNRSTGDPLADIAADSWVVQLGLRQLPWQGRVTLQATLTQPQDRVPAGIQETPGYVVYDLLSSWEPRKDLRLDLAVGNLTDKAYRRHNAVLGETGRNVKASLTWKF